MKNKTKIGKSLLALSAVALVSLASVGSANAYFTTYVQAGGGYTVELGDRTVIQETVSNWVKHFSVTSQADSEPIYIRARAFSGSQYILQYSNPDNTPEGAGTWVDGRDGYWYYSNPDGSLKVVNGGESTSELLIEITNPPENNTVTFNVVVVYESTPIQYHEDGTAYADWTKKLDVVNEKWETKESESDQPTNSDTENSDPSTESGGDN